MRTFYLILCGIAFAGCSSQSVGSVPLSPVQPFALQRLRGGAYKLLHSFGTYPDGASPVAGLIDVGGKLYGTSSGGGSSDYGTVFEIRTSGAEKVLYSFKGGTTDGIHPFGSLLALNGKLYGTTTADGGGEAGTVFEVSTSGAEKTLYSFKGKPDGAVPYGGLIAVGSKLYGTTAGGGSGNYGTVFEVSTSGKEKVLYSFKGGTADGSNPQAALVELNGRLYGTTVMGGTDGIGTVFTVSTSGVENVIHSFTGQPDGVYPYASLTAVDGKLYGTTYTGGANLFGTVFQVSTSGAENVIYSFKGGTDGANPEAGLLFLNGKLYSTTYNGGDSNGTVFDVSTSGVERVLYSFKGDPSSALPKAGLVDAGGKLYGTTVGGGTIGTGTIFKVSP
jgi:uncharacterized repeat protein (TIGR03803 family)